MNTSIASRTIHAPIDRVWRAFDQFDGIATFHPLVERSPALNSVATGVGAERTCHFYSGGAIQERVTLSEAGQRQVVEIFETGPFPIKTAVADFAFTPRGEETDVSVTMRFEPRFGPLGWVLGKLVMESQFAKTLDSVLLGLDDHLRTGLTVGPKGQLEAAPVTA